MLKSDTDTAKNYLSEDEIDTLNRITVMFLDQAEFRAQRRQGIVMADWNGFLEKFLTDMELPLLQGAGSVSHKTAQTIADQQYTQFAEERRLTAQQKADKRYIDDLRQAAALLERQQNRKPDDE